MSEFIKLDKKKYNPILGFSNSNNRKDNKMKTLRILSVFLLSLIILGVGYIVIAAGLGSKSAKEEVQSLEQKQREYISEVILTLTAGSGDYQVGLSECDGVPHGPNRIVVDDSSNVFILDGLNHRIQKYSNQGKFLSSINVGNSIDACVGVDGTLYVLDEGLRRVEQYDQKGSLIEHYEYPMKHAVPGKDHITVNNRGDVFVGDIARLFRLVKDKSGQGFYELQEVKGVPSRHHDIQYQLENKESYAVITVINKEGTVEGEIYPANLGYLTIGAFVGTDKKGGFYLVDWDSKKGGGHQRKVKKYSPNGDLITTIDVPKGYFSYGVGNKDIAIDIAGNVYHFFTEENKTAEVIKWSQYQIKHPQPKERQK